MERSKQNWQESLEIVAPAWPLQNTVAVNPFWFLKHKTFHSALEGLSPVIHDSLFMPLSFYLELVKSGSITESSLKTSIQLNRAFYPNMPNQVADLIKACQEEGNETEHWKTWSEQYDLKNSWHSKVVTDLGKYCAAYLDDQQAIARFPWKEFDFWKSWHHAQKLDVSMERWGAEGFSTFISDLKEHDSETGIRIMLERMGFSSNQSQINYMQRLIASTLGWASQFRYAEWQRQLGYPVENKAELRDLLAVRMAYDFGLFCIFEREDSPTASTQVRSWQASFETKSPSFWRQHCLQLAFEITYQEKTSSQINASRSSTEVNERTPLKQSPKAQLVFCIDVRSEMLRRNIENVDHQLQTVGFAGFFGVPFDYRTLGESTASHRLPVLLSPAFEVKESSPSQNPEVSDQRVVLFQVSSFFRSLRKNPLSSFVYVELFGALYVEKMIKRTFLFLVDSMRSRRIPHRFDPRGADPALLGWTNAQGLPLGDDQKVERAEAVLRHMGLTGPFAPLLLIVGHGSVTTNNAFGSSLDCGACGGNSGDINARILADLLNDAKVRQGLGQKGIQIPSTTWFAAGVHETVTDDVHILEPEKVPLEFQAILSEVTHQIAKASERTRRERQVSRSSVLDSQADRRSRNWSEVRPEWGLAGNACFIVAPRARTRGVDLGGRSFLHDYHWEKDATQNYKTLELIMTAPMVVTNWINLQYYASTVAPKVFGSGNKILHNLTNENGVVEGNGGDLRFGLPIQSVHDGSRFVHDPIRLSVFIEAPQEEIEKIIQKHESVRQLIENDWIHLLQILPGESKVKRRVKGGGYADL